MWEKVRRCGQLKALEGTISTCRQDLRAFDRNAGKPESRSRPERTNRLDVDSDLINPKRAVRG